MTYLPKPGQLVLDEHGREVGRAVEVRRKSGVVVMDPERTIPMWNLSFAGAEGVLVTTTGAARIKHVLAALQRSEGASE